MRVLLVVNTLPPADLSGVGEQVLQLAEGLRARGHEVHVLGRGATGARGPKALFPFTVLPPLLLALRRFRPDVVEVHESDGAIAALAVRVARALSREKPRLVALQQVSYREERRAVRALVAGGRTLGVPGRVERRFRRVKAPAQILFGRWSARLADRVLAPSGATARELERDYGVRSVAVVPNATGGLAVAELAVEGVDGRGFLLFVGRLRIRKGLEVLLAALAETPGAPPLLVAGEGEHRSALEAAARDLGVAQRVRFLGRRSAGEVRWLLARASALVVPSIYEGMPLVVLEAMDAGVPVIASAVSGIPEVVLDGETGWLVPPEDPAALARSIAALARDPAEARRRGEAGRRRVAERYRPSHAAAAWLRALDATGGGETR